VRGLNPYPSAWTTLVRDGKSTDVKIFSVKPAEVSVSAADAISAHGCSGRGPSETGGAVRPARAADTATAAANAGEIKVDGDRLYVSAGDNWLEIKELQMAGKKRMSADAFLRGFREAESYKFV
jgi:methionyl-tRNA formyltransferase